MNLIRLVQYLEILRKKYYIDYSVNLNTNEDTVSVTCWVSKNDTLTFAILDLGWLNRKEGEDFSSTMSFSEFEKDPKIVEELKEIAKRQLYFWQENFSNIEREKN